MNARQAARMAAKHIEELEYYNKLCKRDIKAYNTIIEGMIAGTLNPCDWCDEQPDCPPISQGKGCKEWCLKFDLLEDKKLAKILKTGKGADEQNDGTGTENVTEAVSLTGSTGRA